MSREPLIDSEERGRGLLSRSDRVLGLLRSSQHVRNLTSQVVSRVVALGSFAAVLPFFIIRQGAAAYGVLALLLSIYSFLILLDLGVSYSVGLRIGRSLARRDARASTILAGATPLALALGLLIFLLIEAVARPFSYFLYGSANYTAAIRIFGATVGVFILSSTPAAVVQIHHRVDWFTYSKLIMDVAKSAALLVGAMSRDAIDIAMWVLLVGASLKCILDFLLARHVIGKGYSPIAPLRWSDVRVNFALGLPMSVAGLLTILLTSGDRILVSRIFGPQALADYSLAVDVCSKAYFLVWAITGTVYPLVVRNAASRRDVTAYRRAGLLSVAAVGVLIYLPLAVFARPLIDWWLGAQMARGASLVTSIWCLIAVIFLMSSVMRYQLQAKGRPVLLLGVNFSGIAVLLLGAYLLPRSYGIIGIAMLMGVVYLTQFCIFWIFDNAGNDPNRGRTSVPARGVI